MQRVPAISSSSVSLPELADLSEVGRGILAQRARQLGPATGKTAADMAVASVYAGKQPAATIRAYQLGQRTFADWCAAEGIPYAFPEHAVTPEALALFVDAMAAKGLKPASVDNYVAGVAAMHRQLDIPSPADSRVVKAAKRAHRADVGSEQQQAPALHRADVDNAISSLGTSLIELRDRALVALAYDTLSRASELVALDVSDVRERNGAAYIRIARSKTDQEGKGQFRFVAPDTLDYLQEWIDAARLDPASPLFPSLSTRAQGERLSRRDVARIFAKRIGKPLSAHSARVGAAVDQRAAGLTTGEIAQAGGWKSEAMVIRYTRHLDTQDSAAAKLARLQGRA